MLALRTELTMSLQQRGVLTGPDRVTAAWSGRLLEWSPWYRRTEPDDGPIVVFGISDHSAHFMARFGVLRIDLAELRLPWAPDPGRLGFMAVDPDGTPHHIRIAVEDADTIARQLKIAVEDGVPALRRARREPAKIR